MRRVDPNRTFERSDDVVPVAVTSPRSTKEQRRQRAPSVETTKRDRSAKIFDPRSMFFDCVPSRPPVLRCRRRQPHPLHSARAFRAGGCPEHEFALTKSLPFSSLMNATGARKSQRRVGSLLESRCVRHIEREVRSDATRGNPSRLRVERNRSASHPMLGGTQSQFREVEVLRWNPNRLPRWAASSRRNSLDSFTSFFVRNHERVQQQRAG